MEKNDLMKKIVEDPDFIKAPKYGNSLNKFLAKSDKIPDNKAIGKLLMLPVEAVEDLYEEAVTELRKEMVNEQDKEDSD